MLDFHLFRLVILRPQQMKLSEVHAQVDILREAISLLPSAQLRSGVEWHIGNLKLIDDYGIYFRIGRTSRLTLQLYQDGEFTDLPIETAPYTHAVVDHRLGVCALARNQKLAKTAGGIASKLAQLLSQASPILTLGMRVEAHEIRDPHDFITQLRNAYEVTSFWMSFSQPNPFDADQDIVKPLQRFAAAAHADSGKTELKGRGLDPEVLERVARSAATTGDEAGAWLKAQRGQRREKRSLQSNPAVMQADDASAISSPQRLLSRARDLYHKIRGDNNS